MHSLCLFKTSKTPEAKIEGRTEKNNKEQDLKEHKLFVGINVATKGGRDTTESTSSCPIIVLLMYMGHVTSQCSEFTAISLEEAPASTLIIKLGLQEPRDETPRSKNLPPSRGPAVTNARSRRPTQAPRRYSSSLRGMLEERAEEHQETALCSVFE